MYAREAAAPTSGLGRLVHDLFGGREIDPTAWLGAFSEILGGAGMGAFPGAAVPRGGGTPWGMGGANGQQSRPRPRVHAPPVDPAELELKRALLLARQELGFEPRAPLSVADVERRRKDLARKHHPDLGGDVARMSRINQAADLLVAKGQLG
jgi:hypothetical protein